MKLRETALDARSIVYFSSVSENTKRFVAKVTDGTDVITHRIPLLRTETALLAPDPFLLITPTYGGGAAAGAVPKQVIRFLNDERNRSLIRGVVSCGNTNFGAGFCLAGDIIARKTGVPHLRRVELFGTQEDVANVRKLVA